MIVPCEAPQSLKFGIDEPAAASRNMRILTNGMPAVGCAALSLLQPQNPESRQHMYMGPSGTWKLKSTWCRRTVQGLVTWRLCGSCWKPRLPPTRQGCTHKTLRTCKNLTLSPNQTWPHNCSSGDFQSFTSSFEALRAELCTWFLFRMVE